MLENAKKLIGSTLDVRELSNVLMAMGFEDICWFGNMKELLEDGNMIVADNNGENQIQIFYNVIIFADEDDEVIDASLINIIDVVGF